MTWKAKNTEVSGDGESAPSAERNKRLIVSKTSYSSRMPNIRQMRPDTLVLWLGRDKTPGGLDEVPSDVREFSSRGQTISWCEDMHFYIKLMPAQKTYPDNDIVGAGAVVTHDVPAGTTVVGNPAKTMYERD